MLLVSLSLRPSGHSMGEADSSWGLVEGGMGAIVTAAVRPVSTLERKMIAIIL